MKTNLENKKIGYAKVIKKTNERERNYIVYECKCLLCGKNFKQNSGYLSRRLKSKKPTSCGCLMKHNHLYKHGLSTTRIHKIWDNMIQRCRDKNCTAYKNYGGRGIKVCDEWLKDFMNFYNWAMKNGYQDDLTIDRIDVNGNYEPSNCRWLLKSEQSKNRRNVIYITYNGETNTLEYFAKKFNINKATLYTRLKRGWNIDRMLNEPTHLNYIKLPKNR